MSALIAFVLARLDEWEQTARAATPGPWTAETHHRNLTRAQGRRQFTLHDSPPRVGQVEVGAEVHPVAEEEGNGDGGVLTGADADHIAAHDPAAVLRQVAAMRNLVSAAAGAWHDVQYWRNRPPADSTERTMHDRQEARWSAWHYVLQQLAAQWSDHPDYRQEWAR